MTYVYDLVLNFNEELYEFFEWNKQDNFYHIKKINLIRVDSNTYNEILDNKVIFNGSIFLDIFNKCEYYDKKKIKTFSYVFLLTDSYRTIALMLNDELKVIKYSSLLLDEEEEVNEISSRVPLVKLEYNILEKKNILDFTREERKVIKYIANDLKNTYKNKDLIKLKYLYYEYFNVENDNFEYMYNELLKTLDNYTEKHNNLYKLIKLSCSMK